MTQWGTAPSSLGIPDDIEAVIFDMDGTILDTERLSRVSWYRAAEEFGYNLENVYPSLVGKGSSSCDTILVEYLGPECRIEELRTRKSHHMELLMSVEGVTIKDGVEELLDNLVARAVPTAVATASLRSVAEKRLSLAGLLDRFSVRCFGDDVARSKPAPDLFLLAAKRLSTAPERCFVIEDSHPGVTAALAAGMRVVMVPDLVSPETWVAEHGVPVAASLRDLVPRRTESPAVSSTSP